MIGTVPKVQKTDRAGNRMLALDKGVILQSDDCTDYELDGQEKGMMRVKNFLKKYFALLLALIL